MREQFEKLLAKAQDQHTRNQAVYHKALKDKQNAGVKARAACVAASKTANEIAALNEALAKMPAEEEAA